MCYFVFAIAYLLDPIAFFYGCFKYLKPKYKKYLIYILSCFLFYLAVMIKQYVLIQDNMKTLAMLIFPTTMVIMYAIEYALFRGTKKKRLTLLILICVISIFVDGLFLGLNFVIHIPYQAAFGFTVKGAVNTLFARVISLFLYVILFQRIEAEKRDGVKSVISYGMASVACLIIMVLYIGNDNNSVCYFVIGIHIVLTGIYSLYILKLIKERNNKEMVAVSRVQLMEQQIELVEHARDVTEELRTLRHDIKSHLFLVKELVVNERYDLANDYMDELYGEVEKAGTLCLCENGVLSVVLSYKEKQAKALDITFHHTVTVMEFPLSDFELNSLFSNILNNAFEAVAKIKEKKERMVELEVRQNEWKSIEITCTNTISEIPLKDSNRRIRTTKKDKKKHGIGLKTIEKLVKKNGGYVEVKYDSSRFVILVVLLKQE